MDIKKNLKVTYAVEVASYPTGWVEDFSTIVKLDADLHDESDDYIKNVLQEYPIELGGFDVDNTGVVFNWTIKEIVETEDEPIRYLEYICRSSSPHEDELKQFMQETIDATNESIDSTKKYIKILDKNKKSIILEDGENIVSDVILVENPRCVFVRDVAELNEDDLSLMYNRLIKETKRREMKMTHEEMDFYLNYNVHEDHFFKISPEEAKKRYNDSIGDVERSKVVEEELNDDISEYKERYKTLMGSDDHKLKIVVTEGKEISFPALVRYISHLKWGAPADERGILNYENERVRLHAALFKAIGLDRDDPEVRDTELGSELGLILSYVDEVISKSRELTLDVINEVKIILIRKNYIQQI